MRYLSHFLPSSVDKPFVPPTHPTLVVVEQRAGGCVWGWRSWVRKLKFMKMATFCRCDISFEYCEKLNEPIELEENWIGIRMG